MARRARATPDELEVTGPDIRVGVRKLWVSSDLKSHAYDQAWRQDLTAPDEGFANCKDNFSFSTGPFGFSVGDCDDYDVWQGKVGHMRFDYDSGTYAPYGKSKSIAYTAGFQVENGASVAGIWYEFVTLQIEKQGVINNKCNSSNIGIQNGTTTEKCNF